MKKNTVIFFSFFLLLHWFCTKPAQAQKFGYVDSDFILQRMPEYQKAMQEIEKAAANWEKLIADKFKAVEELKRKYSEEEILLPEEMRKEKQAEIAIEEQKAREYQKSIFGYEGVYFDKKQELIQPAQDELFRAVAKVAREKKVQIMFDKSSDLIMIYTEPRHDYTDFVLKELNLDEGDEKDKDDE